MEDSLALRTNFVTGSYIFNDLIHFKVGFGTWWNQQGVLCFQATCSSCLGSSLGLLYSAHDFNLDLFDPQSFLPPKRNQINGPCLAISSLQFHFWPFFVKPKGTWAGRVPFTHLASLSFHHWYPLYPLTNYETSRRNPVIFWNSIRNFGLTYV